MKTFDNCIQHVLESISLRKQDCEIYVKDAENIRDQLIERMKRVDKDFADAFDGLSLTGSYLDRLKIDLPDEFDIHIKLKMPFEIKPVIDGLRKGFVRLHGIGDNVSHEIVRGRRIKRTLLQTWIRSTIIKALSYFGTEVKGTSEEHIYRIQYPEYARGQSVAHTIKAVDIKNPSRKISFDFVPVFEFSVSQWPWPELPTDQTDERNWFVVPFGKRNAFSKGKASKVFCFMPCAPHWERAVLKDKMNLKNSLRLMKALRDANNFKCLSSYMLKSVYLNNMECYEDTFWEQSPGYILIELFGKLVESLRKRHLPFFLETGFNHYILMKSKDARQYYEKAKDLLEELKLLKDMSYVCAEKVEKIFIQEK